MMTHSNNYPLEHQASLSRLWYIGTQWWESSLSSEFSTGLTGVLQLVAAGFNRRKTSLDGETKPVPLG